MTDLSLAPNINNLARLHCEPIIGRANLLLREAVALRKNLWLNFWDAGIDPAVMQACIMLLSTTPATDLGATTTVLAAMQARGARFIAYALAEDSHSFDAEDEDTVVRNGAGTITGAVNLQPNGQPYVKYRTPGWYYTIVAGVMTVSSPVIWKPPT